LPLLAVCTLLGVGLLAAAGCTRARIAVAIGTNDLVTGEIVVAVVVQSEQEPGAVLSPPPDLSSKVRTEPYRQDGYAGTRMLFTGLTFDELSRLAETPGDSPERVQFDLRRAGNLVLLNGRIDLSGIPNPERTDVQIRISFPGPVVATNGDQQGETVSWIMEAGKVSELTASARFAEPGTRSWQQWALLVGGLAGLVVLMIGLLAYYTHRRFARQAV
jgi:Protein of unknown function (DUF3153)